MVLGVDDGTVVSVCFGRLGPCGQLMEVESSAEIPMVAIENANFLRWVVLEADERFVQLAASWTVC